MNYSMLARLAGGGLLVGSGFGIQAKAAVSEADLAQIALNAISLCVHAALYQHDGLDAAALYKAALNYRTPGRGDAGGAGLPMGQVAPRGNSGPVRPERAGNSGQPSTAPAGDCRLPNDFRHPSRRNICSSGFNL